MLKSTLLFPAAILASMASAQTTPPQAPAQGLVPTPVAIPTLATPLTVIFTNIASSPLSEVPGLPGVRFDGFGRPNLSPNGLNYVITAAADLPTAESDLLIANGVVILRESEAPSFLAPGNTIGNFDQGASINDAGQVAFSVDTTAATTEDDVIARYDGPGSFSLIAQENSPVVGGPVGWIYDSLNTSVITNSGVVGYESDSIDGTAGGTSDDNAMFMGPMPFAQKGVDIPAGQLTGNMDPWDDFDTADLFINASGTRYILQGDVDSSSTLNDDVVVVDGTIVVQEGFPLIGGDPTQIVDSSGIAAVFMSGGGDWTAEGDFDGSNVDWVIYNGDLIAREGDPIHPGSTETWGTPAFIASTCNSVGDFIVGGDTDMSDATRDQVIVLNGERVVMREGDPVDLDGNGLFDDGLFVNIFGTDDFRLTDDLQLFFTATVREAGSTTTVGSIFGVLDLRDSVGSTICAGQPNSTGGESRLGAMGSSTVADNNLTLEVEGLPSGQFGFFVTSLGTGFVANPGGSAGDLCIADPVLGRYSNMVQTTSATGSVSQTLDLTMIPLPIGFTAVVAGETRYWQFWHRDTVAGVAGSNFSTALGVTFE